MARRAPPRMQSRERRFARGSISRSTRVPVRPGEPISATLDDPILASDGKVLVSAGTKLEGQVAAVDHVHGPRIELAFDSLALEGGRAPLGVRIVSAEQSRYRAIPAPSGVTSAQPPAQGQPEQPTAVGAQSSEQISMPRGAALELVLTRPIVKSP